MNKITLILLTGFLFLQFSCKQDRPVKFKSRDKNYIDVDLKPDLQNPAGMIELKFNSQGSDIYGFEYTANGAGPHPTVILLHGNPGNERNLDLAQNLRRNGYNVVYFDFRGSWGSEGEFTYANNIEDTRTVIDYITDSTKNESMRIDTSKIFLIGHNFAAGTALLAGLDDKRIKGIVGLSLFNPYKMLQGADAHYNANDIYTYLNSGLGMLKIDPDKYLKDILKDIDGYNLEQMISTTTKPVLIIDEHNLNEYLKMHSSNKNITYEIWATDIAFTNQRIALSKRIKTWLDKALITSRKRK